MWVFNLNFMKNKVLYGADYNKVKQPDKIQCTRFHWNSFSSFKVKFWGEILPFHHVFILWAMRTEWKVATGALKNVYISFTRINRQLELRPNYERSHSFIRSDKTLVPSLIRYQLHGLIPWPISVTRIKTVEPSLLLEVPSNCPSVQTD